MSGTAKEAVPWSKEIVVRLYQCLQRYPFRPEIRDRAVELVRKRCLQLITADDFKELGKELSDIIHPVKLQHVLQTTCNVSGPAVAPANGNADTNSNGPPYKRRRSSMEVDGSGKPGMPVPGAGSNVIKPEAVRLGLPGGYDAKSGRAGREDMVHCLLNLVSCMNLSSDQLASLIEGLEQLHQERRPNSNHGHPSDSLGPDSSYGAGYVDVPRSLCDTPYQNAAGATAADLTVDAQQLGKGAPPPHYNAMDGTAASESTQNAAQTTGIGQDSSGILDLFSSPTHWAAPFRSGQPAFNATLDAVMAQAASLAGPRPLVTIPSLNGPPPATPPSLPPHSLASLAPGHIRWWPPWQQGARNYPPPPTSSPTPGAVPGLTPPVGGPPSHHHS